MKAIRIAMLIAGILCILFSINAMVSEYLVAMGHDPLPLHATSLTNAVVISACDTIVGILCIHKFIKSRR